MLHTLLLLLALHGAAAGGAFPALTSPSATRTPAAGLLPVDDRFLLRTGLLSLAAAPTATLPGGGWAIETTVHRANSFAKSPDLLVALGERPSRAPAAKAGELPRPVDAPAAERRYLVDGELSELELVVRRGLGRGLEASVGLRLLEAGGGAYDSAIEGFHDAFGFDQAGRSGLHRDDYGVYVETADGVVEAGDRPAGLADLRLGLQWQRPAGRGPWDLALRGVVELPTGDRDALFANDDVDAGLQVLASRRLGRGRLHLAGAVLSTGAWDALGLGRELLLGVHLGYERPLFRRHAALVQVHAGESPFASLGLTGLDEDVVLVTLGLKRRLASGGDAFFAITENALHYENSADVALHVGISTGLAGGARNVARR